MGVYLLVFGVVWNSPFANGATTRCSCSRGCRRLDVRRGRAAVVDALDARQRESDPEDAVPAAARPALRRRRAPRRFGAMLALVLILNFIALSRVRATEWLAIPLAALFVAFVAGIALAAASLNVSSATSSSSSRRCSCRGSS